MNFDKWCEKHGAYLNDSDDGAKSARLLAQLAFEFAAYDENERCERICFDVKRSEQFAQTPMGCAFAIRLARPETNVVKKPN